MTEAARLTEKTIQSVSKRVQADTLTGYENKENRRPGQSAMMVSKAQLERLGFLKKGQEGT